MVDTNAGHNFSGRSDQKYERNHTFLVVGDRKVGKTTLRKLCFENKNYPMYLPTEIKESSYLKIERVKDIIHLMVWEINDFVKPNDDTVDIIENSDGLILVVDLSKRLNVKKISKYIEVFTEHKGNSDFNIAITFHKSDLAVNKLNTTRQNMLLMEIFNEIDINKLNISKYKTSIKNKKGSVLNIQNFINQTLEDIDKRLEYNASFQEKLFNSSILPNSETEYLG